MLVSRGDEVKQCWRKIGIVYLVIRVQQRELIGAFELLLELCRSSHNHLPRKTWNFPVRRNIHQRNNFISLQPYANRFCNLSIRSPSVREFLLRIQLNENVMKMWKSPVTRAAVMFQQKCVKFRESCNLCHHPRLCFTRFIKETMPASTSLANFSGASSRLSLSASLSTCQWCCRDKSSLPVVNGRYWIKSR